MDHPVASKWENKHDLQVTASDFFTAATFARLICCLRLAGSIDTGFQEGDDIDDQSENYDDYYHDNRCVIDDGDHIYIHALNHVLHAVCSAPIVAKIS